MRTIVIELRMDDSDKEAVLTMIQASREAARMLQTTAALISTKRKPQIKLETGDLFAANEQLSILTDEELVNEVNPVTQEGNTDEEV